MCAMRRCADACKCSISVQFCQARSRNADKVSRIHIGRDVATDVSFSLSRPIPERAFGLSERDAPQAEEMKKGPLIDGIPIFGPG